MTIYKESRNAPQWLNRSLGFTKTHNFVLWFILAGALFGFSLSRLMYLDKSTYEAGALPGEAFWYHAGHYRVGIFMHLVCILPAGLLVPWQFVPQIRHKSILFHRINGYTIIVLVFAATAAALMLIRRAFGGSISEQLLMVTTAFMTLGALVMAWINIKRLQIEEHRKWATRAMVWMAVIIDSRLVMLFSALIISKLGGYATIWRCDELEYTYGTENFAEFQESYPSCINAAPSQGVIVPADMNGTSAASAGSALRETFPAAMWFCLILHVFGTECYFALTKNETERLRQASYKMQLERGCKHPGSAGLTSDRFGDSTWAPPHVEEASKPPKEWHETENGRASNASEET